MTVQESTNLPAGTVTFVFTDIEGSTRLLKELGEDGAALVFTRHDELLREVWTAHDGVEVNTEGDSFFVAFDDPSNAVAACVDAQRRLDAESWHGAVTVRVRMGIHTGLAAPRGDNYVSLAVHQANRVMSAAHGGQVLITDAAAALVTTADDVGLTPIGTYTLRDFDHGALLHRIDPVDLTINDTAIRATPANRHNLVPNPTTFVGREADLVAVNGLLEIGRIVTIVGPGGVGKTRLATEIGIDVADDWPDGVWMIELGDAHDDDLLVELIGTTIGALSDAGSDQWSSVIDHLQHRQALLVLDNAEHVIARCAELADDLRRRCPRLALLVTSREPLNVTGEHLYRLQPLASNGRTPAADSAAVRLFTDRATARRGPGEHCDDTDETATIAAICKSLDGLPLAIEIAAARAGVMQLAEILAGLEDRFRLLRSRDRSRPERHRTMNALLGWSYRLLNDQEQRALRRLAVFTGDFGIDDAVEALRADDLDTDDIPELLWSLVDKSLLSRDLAASSNRYRLAETVQQFALRQLMDTDEPQRVATQLAEAQLERVGPWVTSDRRWLGDMAIELANIRGVVDLIAEAEPEKAQQLMCSVARYHDSVQNYAAGIDEIERAVARIGTATPSLVALRAELAYLHLRRADTAAAEAVLATATTMQSAVGPPNWNDAAVERARGEIATRRGEFDTAAEIAATTLDRPLSERGQAQMWSLRGVARCQSGNLEQGLGDLLRALEIYARLGEVAHTAIAHANVAEAAYRLGDTALAAEHQRETLRDGIALGHQVAIATSLLMASQLCAIEYEWEPAVILHGHADFMLASSGHELYADEVAESQALIDGAELSEQRVAELTATAESMSTVDVVELADRAFQARIDRSATSLSPT